MTLEWWWHNIANEADREILAIDRMGEGIAPIAENVLKIRGLIGTLEMCHHKAERWVSNITEAISTGETTKGLGTRTAGQVHPAETVWMNAWAALSAWVAGCPASAVDRIVGSMPATQILAGIGKRSPLKEWQVQRAAERIRSLVYWGWIDEGPLGEYVWLYHDQTECPDRYKEHEDFWRETVETIPFRALKHGDKEEDFSLGLAIDLLWPCHWNFVENLQIVLNAIGGEADPDKQYATCAWNIVLSPIRPRMGTTCSTLRVFCGQAAANQDVDEDLLSQLGRPTQEKRWLVASLEKTIRSQLNLGSH